MNTIGSFESLLPIVDGLNRKFPTGNLPYQMIARLCEEAGELAKEVNHFEGSGVKMQKYGNPDRVKLANEVRDVICTALSLARWYGIERELTDAIDARHEALQRDGHVPQESRGS